MINILTIVIISILAASILLIGAISPVFALNMRIDNSIATVQNTTEITDTEMGLDAIR
jgi:hypothetical protein